METEGQIFKFSPLHSVEKQAANEGIVHLAKANLSPIFCCDPGKQIKKKKFFFPNKIGLIIEGRE